MLVSPFVSSILIGAVNEWLTTYFTLKNATDDRKDKGLNRSILFRYVRIQARSPDNADGVLLSVKIKTLPMPHKPAHPYIHASLCFYSCTLQHKRSSPDTPLHSPLPASSQLHPVCF